MNATTVLVVLLVLMLLGALPVWTLKKSAVFSSASLRIVALARAAFSDHVLRVVFRGSNKQVRWVAARRVVTMVQDEKSWWDRAVNQLPSDTMGGKESAAIVQMPVSFAIGGPGPYQAPAARYVFELRQQLLRERHPFLANCVSASPRTRLAPHKPGEIFKPTRESLPTEKLATRQAKPLRVGESVCAPTVFRCHFAVASK